MRKEKSKVKVKNIRNKAWESCNNLPPPPQPVEAAVRPTAPPEAASFPPSRRTQSKIKKEKQ